MGRCKVADCKAWEFEAGYCRRCLTKIKAEIKKKRDEERSKNNYGGTLLTGGSLDNSDMLGSVINSINRYSNIEGDNTGTRTAEVSLMNSGGTNVEREVTTGSIDRYQNVKDKPKMAASTMTTMLDGSLEVDREVGVDKIVAYANVKDAPVAARTAELGLAQQGSNEVDREVGVDKIVAYANVKDAPVAARTAELGLAQQGSNEVDRETHVDHIVQLKDVETGEKVPEAPAAAPAPAAAAPADSDGPTNKFCPECGTKVTAKFCGECGNRC